MHEHDFGRLRRGFNVHETVRVFAQIGISFKKALAESLFIRIVFVLAGVFFNRKIHSRKCLQAFRILQIIVGVGGITLEFREINFRASGFGYEQGKILKRQF